MSTFSLDRSNAKNTGKAFERELEMTCRGYEMAHVATISKVDPPTRVVGGDAARRVIFLPNPFLDMVGVWTANGARPLFIEAKSTSTHLLPFRRDGGLTEAQCLSLDRWERAGATVGLVWQFFGRVVAIPHPQRLDLSGAKSLRFEDYADYADYEVGRGTGLVVWSFLDKFTK